MADEKVHIGDIEQIQHHDSGYLKALAYGRTTGGDYVPLLLNDDGSLA